MTDTKILIGTPTLSQEVTTEYLNSVFNLQRSLRGSNVDLELFTNSGSLIGMARNLIASVVLDRRDITHLLFVDADMGFQPNLIVDMINFNKPVVGSVAPKRRLALVDVQRSPTSNDENAIHYQSNAYVAPGLITDHDGNCRVVRGQFAPAFRAGTGIMLIQRAVFEALANLPGMLIDPFEPPSTRYPRRLLNCFSHLSNEQGIQLSEDLSFCKRWINDCGGEIWVSVGHEITHSGQFTFRGKFIEKLLTES